MTEINLKRQLVPFELIGKYSKDKVAFVDKELVTFLNKFGNWYVNKAGYSMVSKYPNGRGTPKKVFMHNFIWELCRGKIPEGLQVDHINNNRLDNRMENLRLATPLQNMMNRKKQANPTTSFYKGVNWSKLGKKWVARISYNGKRLFLGYFNSEIEAANIYDQKAKYYFGQFAKLNLKYD